MGQVNRRVRTLPVELNAHGAYVCYLTLWETGRLLCMALLITTGPSAGLWRAEL